VLGIRVLVGVIVIPVVLALTYVGGLAFALFVGILAGLGSYELYGMTSRSGWHPSRILGIAASVALCLSFEFGGGSLPGLVFAALVLVLLVERTARSSREQYLGSLAVTLMGVVYCGWLLGFFIWLRSFGGSRFSAGPQLVYFVLVLTWSYDSVAYLVGSLVGRRRLFPGISPSKTTEGTVAGLCGCVVAALVSRATFASFLRYGDAVLLGLLMGVAAQAGDLAESMIKRSVGAKDSSNLIPGHGGFLDRFDSLLVAGPAFYFYVRAFLS
jgi:phosphatidate cytidylyltransferase